MNLASEFSTCEFMQSVQNIKSLRDEQTNQNRLPADHPVHLYVHITDTSPRAKKLTTASSLISDEQGHAGKCGTRSPCLLVYGEEKLALV